jgi:hypothetical protein
MRYAGMFDYAADCLPSYTILFGVCQDAVKRLLNDLKRFKLVKFGYCCLFARSTITAISDAGTR